MIAKVIHFIYFLKKNSISSSYKWLLWKHQIQIKQKRQRTCMEATSLSPQGVKRMSRKIDQQLIIWILAAKEIDFFSTARMSLLKRNKFTEVVNCQDVYATNTWERQEWNYESSLLYSMKLGKGQEGEWCSAKFLGTSSHGPGSWKGMQGVEMWNNTELEQVV